MENRNHIIWDVLKNTAFMKAKLLLITALLLLQVQLLFSQRISVELNGMFWGEVSGER